jgi:UDP-N-acetylglucosamine--N-acetylmuramyl-(pentapeptide) pyrophosphoryl-undecaprenol N-acetylglucosamine transferase
MRAVCRFGQCPLRRCAGANPLAALQAGVVLAAGFVVALRLMRDLRPAAILGTGGYVCVPIFLAARVMQVPTMIYLPDVVPGLAVGLLARIATRVALNVPDARQYLPTTRAEPLISGYPVRKALFDQDRAICRQAFELDDQLPVLLVYGGSRGARSVNRAIAALLADLLEVAQIIHVCGREGDRVWLSEAAAQLPEPLQRRYHLYEYLESEQAADDGMYAPTMVRAFGAADLALCRSGASTLAELPAGRPAGGTGTIPVCASRRECGLPGATWGCRESGRLGDARFRCAA